MNGYSYENQGSNTLLVYEVGANDELDTMSLGMLTNNKIPGFAPTIFTQVDNTKYIKYNVSAKVSVAQLFSGPVNKKRLLGVFTGIVDAMLSAEDYMLDTDAMLLDLEHIFADVSTCETVLICLPVMNSGHQNPELSMFFKNIIFNTQFDQTENCDHVAQILNYLNSVKALSLPDFKELLKSMSKPKEAPKPVSKPVAAAPVQPAVSQPAAPQPVAPQHVVSAPQVKPQAEIPVKSNAPVPLNKDMMPNMPELPEKNQDPDEKPMSMFYLLQHYNKENAAKYKAQQAAKKDSEKKDKQDKKDKKGKKDKKEAAPKQAPQSVNAGFAIPGQQPPLNTSFEVPGAPKPAPEFKPAPQTAKAQPVIQKPQPAPVVAPQPAVQAGKPLNFGETTVLGGGAIGETTVLGVANVDAPKANPYLVRAKNNEKIPLNKPVFRIGKERSYVDYFIGDNTAISRSHANIVDRDGQFFVVDTNSTNHTYVNGTMVHSNEETAIYHNDRIRLANEEFVFNLY